MGIWFKNAFAVFAAFVFRLRYRVELKGLETVRNRRGVLFLPDHPAYTDPPLLLVTLWSQFRPRPMLLARMFAHPIGRFLPWILRAVEVPDLLEHSAEARKEAHRAIAEVAAGLRQGDNMIVWPAGRVQRGGAEVLGSTRGAADILTQVEGAEVVLVRTTGLRGSTFSYARTGSAPKLFACLLRGALVLLSNLVFFTPRRRVCIELRGLAPGELPERDRESLNPFLESWYNELGEEPKVHVPYHCLFGARDYRFPEAEQKAARTYDHVSEKVQAAVAELLRERMRGVEDPLDQPDRSLDQLGFDSLDRMEVSLDLEQRFGFRSDEIPETLGDLWDLAEGHAESGAQKIEADPQWRRDPARSGSAEILGDTLVEALLLRARQDGRAVLGADDTSGVLTYERFLVGAQVLARRIEKLVPADRVGVLLPATLATDLLIFAIYFAGKVPVLLNWTTGPGQLAHAAKSTGMSHVLTAKRFADRTGILVEGAEFLFLEDLRGDVGKLELLRTLLRTRFAPGSVQRRVSRARPEDHAVILFTSGSEKAPKAVPLTHHNILSNTRSVLEAFPLYRSDVFLGFLPPFHSFGFTVSVMLPILAGFRIVHHPDPTDAGALARKLSAYSATLVGATPTFLGYILKRCSAEDLASLRWAVVGGEKCPDVLYESFATLQPDAELLEGYGVTECSPLVACTQPGGAQRGTLGDPLPGVELRIVDPDTLQPLPRGQVGMLLVAGDNVFSGYLEEGLSSPFLDLDGRRWYRTGDLVLWDDDGAYHFRGRLKRFLKVAGEMVSLPALEAAVVQHYPPAEEGPQVAVEGVDQPERWIVLFTTTDLDLRTANRLLQEHGLGGVIRFDEVRRLEAIPVLGTGKVDYKVLRRAVEDR